MAEIAKPRPWHRKTFFIVFSPTGSTPPVKVHASHKEAFGIAHRMAAAHPGQDFHVMASVSRPIRFDELVADVTGTPLPPFDGTELREAPGQ